MTCQQAAFAVDPFVATQDSTALHASSLEAGILSPGIPALPSASTPQSENPVRQAAVSLLAASKVPTQVVKNLALAGRDAQVVGAVDHGGAGGMDKVLQIDTAMSDAQRAELLRLVGNFVQRKVWAKPKRKSTPKDAPTRTVLQLDLFEIVQAAELSPAFSTKEHA